MAVRNNNITDIYNLSRSIDLAIIVNNNTEGTNKAKSGTSKSDFANIYNWDLNINIEQDYLGELEAAFNTLKDKCAEIEHLTEDNWRFINKFFKCNKKDLSLPIKLLGYLRAIYIY